MINPQNAGSQLFLTNKLLFVSLVSCNFVSWRLYVCPTCLRSDYNCWHDLCYVETSIRSLSHRMVHWSAVLGWGFGKYEDPLSKKKWWGFNAGKPFPHNLMIISRQFYCQQISGLDHDKIEVVVVSFVRTTKMVSSPWSDDSIWFADTSETFGRWSQLVKRPLWLPKG